MVKLNDPDLNLKLLVSTKLIIDLPLINDRGPNLAWQIDLRFFGLKNLFQRPND